jgi:general secretion pathway protein A
MYKSFFGLRENPFNVNPDPRYLFLTTRTRKALDQLTYGVRHSKGLVLLTGEVGTGKTTLVNCLLNWLRVQKTPTALIFNPRLTVNHLFDFILTDFGVPIDFRLNGNMLMRLNLWLLERHRAGEKPVLIVDEAQGLSTEALEEIRLLLNLETDAEKLLQIVLVGQPELEDKLKRPELRQIRQRIELRCSTAPLEVEEARSYITERLRIAGADGRTIFPVETMDAVHSYAKGIPRVINLLCEHALINAFADQYSQVPVAAVEEAARDFLLPEIRPDTVKHPGEDGTGGGPPALQSTFEEQLARQFTTLEAGLREQAPATWPSAPAELAIQESAAIKAMSTVIPIRRPGDDTWEETRNSPFPQPTAISCAGEQKLAAAAKKNLTFLPQKRAAKSSALPSVLHVYAPTWIRPLAFVLELQEVVSAVAEQNKQFTYATKLLRSWVVDFGRDWNAMMNAIEAPRSARYLLQWLRQPANSKHIDSGRNQPV